MPQASRRDILGSTFLRALLVLVPAMREDNGLDLSLDLWLKLAHPLGYVRDPQLRKFWLHSERFAPALEL
jgi:hypothetical protein